MPVVSPSATWLTPKAEEALHVRAHDAGSTLPSNGQPKATDTVPTMRKRPSAARTMSAMFCHCSARRAVQVLLRVRLGGRDQQADLVRAVAGLEVGEGALDRVHVGAGGLVDDTVSALQRLQQSLASANCGTTFGLE